MDRKMTTNRRDFLRDASFITAGAAVGTQLLTSSGNRVAEAAPPPKKQMGLQVYSLRGDLHKDRPAGLARLAKLGFTELELFSYNESGMFVDTKDAAPISPEEYKKRADDAGLKIVSSHCYAPGLAGPFQDATTGYSKATVTKWEEFFKKAADIHAKIGVSYLLQAGMADCENMDHVKFQCDLFNRIGEITKTAGLKFGYHNHSGEFRNIPCYVVPSRNDVHVPGRYPHVNNFEKFIIEGTDPGLVLFELDVYWAVVGIQDPLEWFSRYPDRFRLMHIKDRWIIGASGVMNFENIFKKAYEIGIQHYFVEIEANTNDPKASQWHAVEESAQYIRNASFVKAM
jgi:sugar phosphate isomerase/epimerase